MSITKDSHWQWLVELLQGFTMNPRDFNSRPLGERPIDKELQTQAVGIAGSIFGAQEYEICGGSLC